MAALRREVSEEAAGVAAGRAARRLVEIPEVARAPRIAFYAALADELPTDEILAVLRAQRVMALLPRCTAENRLEFVAAESFEGLVTGRYGVREPEGVAVTLGPADVVVAPGLAFDAEGRRLGRGGGYYDRTFPDVADSPFLIGVGYAFQRVEEVPAGPQDRRMQVVVNDIECLRVKERHGG